MSIDRRSAVPDPEAIARFEVLFERAPLSMQLLAADGRTLRVNAAWEALWEVRDGDGVKAYVLGEYNILADPQLEARGILPVLRRAFAGESVELPAIRYDPGEIGRAGRARWVRASAHPLLDPGGGVREVLLIHEDITESRRVEEELRATEERLRLALLAGQIGIWEWEIEPDVVSWTDEVYALHGREKGTFGGSARDFASMVHPEDLPATWEKIRRAAADSSGFSADFRVVLPDGTPRWLSTWARVHPGSRGRRMIGATISIDAYKRAETALREGDRRKDEFLAMLAHELRNPLAPISAAAHLLSAGRTDPARVQAASEVLVRQVAHVTRLVDDLLDVSRVTRGLVELALEPVDLRSIALASIEQVVPLMQARSHGLACTPGDEPVYVSGDRARLVQVLVNLLSNAARYTPPGGRIEVRVAAEGDTAVIEVIDNGQGIDAELLPHVFELFVQGTRGPDRSQGGLGIGLALVQRLVALHGGQVTAASAGVGAGSTFRVELPLHHATPTQDARPAPDPAPAAQPLRVVLVDDNQDAADALAMLLRLRGHEVDVFNEARAALRCAAADVFVLDIGLPGIDGLALARELRTRHPSALYVAVTGYGQASDREQTAAAGFDHHCVKPVAWPAFAELIEGAHAACRARA